MTDLDRVTADNRVTLSIPHDWRRSSITIFSNGQDGRDTAAVVVRREAIDPRMSLEQHVDTMLVDLARSIPYFTILDRRQRSMGDQCGIELIYTLKTKDIVHLQRQFCLIDTPGTVLTLTASSAQERARDWAELFDEIIGSLAVSEAAPRHS